MLIVCPNCDSSFELDSSLLAPSGRELQCSECGHKWFCGPDGLPVENPNLQEQQIEQENASEIADSLARGESTTEVVADKSTDEQALDEQTTQEEKEDVGEALSALDDEEEETDSDHTASEEEIKLDKVLDGESDEDSDKEDDADIEEKIRAHENKIRRRSRRRVGAGNGWFGWLVLLAFLGGATWAGYHYRLDVVAYYPSSAELYQRLGWMRPLGEGLKIIEPRIETLESSNGDKSLLIVGEIYNTLTGSQNVLDVPLLRGALIDANDREVRVWVFSAARDRILPNERIIYRTEVGDPPSNVRALKVTFARPGED